MSRSYKKSPVCNDHSTPNTSWDKRQANKAVRRYMGVIPNGNCYRKLYCSWNICDYRFYEPLQKAIHEWESEMSSRCLWLNRQSKQDIINNWAKFYRRK